MEREDLEFLLTQYLDGDLTPEQRADVEKSLSENADARAQLETCRKLDQALRAAMPLPAIRWHALSKHISSIIAVQPAPASSYKFPRAWIGGAALAACALIAFSVTLHRRHDALTPNDTTAIRLPPTGSAHVTGPQIESAAGWSLATVTLDSAPRMASAFDAYPSAEGVVAEPSRVSIASAFGVR